MFFSELAQNINIDVAKKYTIELAIMLGYFEEFNYYASMRQDQTYYPTVPDCVNAFPFWSKEKILDLIRELYLNDLI